MLIDPAYPLNKMLVQLVSQTLARQHPELFGSVTPANLAKWIFFYGYEDSRESAEELDPRLSLHQLGVFPGSTITVGPPSCF